MELFEGYPTSFIRRVWTEMWRIPSGGRWPSVEALASRLEPADRACLALWFGRDLTAFKRVALRLDDYEREVALKEAGLDDLTEDD